MPTELPRPFRVPILLALGALLGGCELAPSAVDARAEVGAREVRYRIHFRNIRVVRGGLVNSLPALLWYAAPTSSEDSFKAPPWAQ